jgi:hypothetical protein
MAVINALNCITTAGNTGVGACSFDPSNIVGAIIAPKGYEFDVTSPLATLIAATHNPAKGSRLYPVYDLEGITDSSEQKIIFTAPYGQKHVVREGYNDWLFMYVSGALSVLKNLRKFNGPSWDFYFLDANGVLLGIAGSTSTKLRAIPSTGGYFWAGPFKTNDGSKITEYPIQFVFNQKYLNDQFKYLVTGIDMQSLVYGLQDLNLTSTVNATSGSYNVTVLTDATNTNMGDVNSAGLAVVGNWTAAKTSTGGAIAITSVTYDSVNKWFVLALNKADANYPTPGAGVYVTLNLAAPAVLQAAGVDGYESTGSVGPLAN